MPVELLALLPTASQTPGSASSYSVTLKVPFGKFATIETVPPLTTVVGLMDRVPPTVKLSGWTTVGVRVRSCVTWPLDERANTSCSAFTVTGLK